MDILFLFGPLAALVLCERVPRLRFERSAFLRPHFRTDLIYFASSAVGLGLLVRAVAFRLTGVLGVVAPGVSALPAPWMLLTAIVVYDLGAYVSHLMLHRSESLWRTHKVHHSSPTLDWLATFRAHFVEHGLRHIASTGVLFVVGFPFWAVAAAGAVHAAWAAFVHSNLRLDLRWIELLFITPRLHRLHHVASTGDRNLGTLFSLWDRLRGSLLDDPHAAPGPLGVPGELETYPQSWVPQLVEPFRGAGSRAALAS